MWVFFVGWWFLVVAFLLLAILSVGTDAKFCNFLEVVQLVPETEVTSAHTVLPAKKRGSAALSVSVTSSPFV